MFATLKKHFINGLLYCIVGIMLCMNYLEFKFFTDVYFLLMFQSCIVNFAYFHIVQECLKYLNQAHTWFLKIDPVLIVGICVFVCVYVCVCVSVPKAINNQ